MNNLSGFVLSFVLIFGIIGLVTILEQKQLLSKEGSRKAIHIAVANWWILAMVAFDSLIYAALVPFLFIIINYLAFRYEALSAMKGQRERPDLGTVYFPISLFLLALLSFGPYAKPYVGALGILVMGYGDGLAAVIGQKYGTHHYRIGGREKSLEGSLTMLVVSFALCLGLLLQFDPAGAFGVALLLSLVATLTEAISPYGTDNLTVPLITSLLYFSIFF